MSGKVIGTSFENQFEDYDPNTCVILNKKQNGISDSFREKLKKYKAQKHHLLLTELKDDINHDYSVYTGSCGLAMYYYTVFLSSNPKKDSSNYLIKSMAFIELERLKGNKISFLCGDGGPLALACVISYKLSDTRPSHLPSYEYLAERLIELQLSFKESPNELLYGRAGYLYALLFVNAHIVEHSMIPTDLITHVAGGIINSGKNLSTKLKHESPLLWKWHDKYYLGAAHGAAGILYILLQAHQYISDVDMIYYVKPTIDWLMTQKFTSDNYRSSVNSTSKDRLVQWCHGAPGFTALFLKAHQVLREEKYLHEAIKCGEVVWQRGLTVKGYSLCHGVAGNAYTFIQLYQATKEPKYLYRACCFMTWCLQERKGTEEHKPDRPASLFEGLVGRLYLAEDLMDIEHASFPGYTI